MPSIAAIFIIIGSFFASCLLSEHVRHLQTTQALEQNWQQGNGCRDVDHASDCASSHETQAIPEPRSAFRLVFLNFSGLSDDQADGTTRTSGLYLMKQALVVF